MGKTTGFLEYKRENNTDVPVKERITNFREFHLPLSDEKRMEQGARCMDCGVPFCQSAMRLKGMVTGCPLHNMIPEWNDALYHGHTEHALARLVKTSNFPEFTGRVCPALCEKACINGEHGDAVTVHDNELYIIEKGFENGYVKPRIPAIRSGKKVAVIGSGPSGLAAADELNRRGHTVTVYERDDRPGGLLMYGIPNMKLDKTVIERRVNLMKEEGVTFLTGIDVGKDITSGEILKENDVVILACGAKQARSLNGADSEKIHGIYNAVDFLKSTTKALLQRGVTVEELMKGKDFISAKDKHVVVVGGGDTGNDCIGTVIRHGCKSVTALEMMPAPPAERSESNPWPEWPKVLKTDYGHEEAIELFGHDPRIYETTVKEYITDKKGNLKKIVIAKVSFKDRKMELVEGSEKEIPCDMLLIAAGFTGCERYTADAFDVKLTERNTVQTDSDGYLTSKDRVFVAGDMRRGQSLVVWAIAEGRACAAEADRYLMGYTNLRIS
jgi:glutamate synthase (NADPH/NADH) small chain